MYDVLKLSCEKKTASIPDGDLLSLTVGPMEVRILRSVVVLCKGEAPSTGIDDSRFVIQGDQNHPDTRVWPGLKLARNISVGGRQLQVVCCVREGLQGPVFTCRVAEDDIDPPVRLLCVGSSMTPLVREFLGQLLVQLSQGSERDEDDDRDVETAANLPQIKGPSFFGLRTHQISSVLDVAAFPGADKETQCVCLESENLEDVDVSQAVELRDMERDPHSQAMLEHAKVRWNGIASLGSHRFRDKSGWHTNFQGVKLALRPGFSVAREVLTASGKWVTVVAKIVVQDDHNSGQDPLPVYECFA